MGGGKQWFVYILPDVITEVFTFGDVSESFFDENDFLLYRDKEGNVWHINSTVNYLTRSKFVYLPSIISKRMKISVYDTSQNSLRRVNFIKN